MTLKHLKNWERARVVYPRHQIVSSDWGPMGRRSHFHPSYNCEGKPDMTKLIAMEYARVWTNERYQWREKVKLVTREEREKRDQKDSQRK